MDRVRKAISIFTNWFNKLDPSIKIVFYVLVSGLLTQVVTDVNALNVTNEYAKLFIMAFINLIQYLIIQLGQYKQTKQVGDAYISVSIPANVAGAKQETKDVLKSVK